MITDTGMIVVSIISLAGMVLIFTLNNTTWFKKERFKQKQALDRKEANIRFKSLERDLKLKEIPPIPPREKGIVETLGDLNPDMIKTLAGALTKDDIYEEDYKDEKPDITEIIADVAKSNPELVTQLIDKFTKKSPGAGNEWKAQE